MFAKLASLVMLAADTTPASPSSPPAGPPPSGLEAFFRSPVALIILVLVVMYFLVMGPQRKKEKKRRAMLDAIGKGDNVVTIGGIHGTITQVKTDTIDLDIGGNAKMTVSRGAIARVVTDSDDKGTQA